MIPDRGYRVTDELQMYGHASGRNRWPLHGYANNRVLRVRIGKEFVECARAKLGARAHETKSLYVPLKSRNRCNPVTIEEFAEIVVTSCNRLVFSVTAGCLR